MVGIGPFHLDSGGALEPTRWTSFLYGVRFTAQFLTMRSEMKSHFFGTTCIGTSVVGIGPIHLDPGGALGPTGLTSVLYGVQFIAQFLTKMSGMKKSFFWDNLYLRIRGWYWALPFGSWRGPRANQMDQFLLWRSIYSSISD